MSLIHFLSRTLVSFQLASSWVEITHLTVTMHHQSCMILHFLFLSAVSPLPPLSFVLLSPSSLLPSARVFDAAGEGRVHRLINEWQHDYQLEDELAQEELLL